MAGLWAGTCSAFEVGPLAIRAGRMAVASSQTVDLTRALANDLDPCAWPCCSHLNLRLWSSLTMLEPCSCDFMDQPQVVSSKFGIWKAIAYGGTCCDEKT